MIYFASDFHLGMPEGKPSQDREKKICNWLDEVSKDATQIFLLGDVFDFWFEYKTVVPKGSVRFLGKLAELTDKGVDIQVCVGNHDLWMRNYLVEECGIQIFREPKIIQSGDKKIYIHHGDGLGPGDKKYKFLKKMFLSPINQWLFSKIHPNLGVRMARYWSKSSRKSTPSWEKEYRGDGVEYLTLHCNEVLKSQHIDYFVFGHRHLELDITLDNGVSKYINLGQWFTGSRYIKLNDGVLEVRDYSQSQG
jgi:UDP-2,3-diacylglucosamine hydrolase